jgi:hypothetical protein
MTVEATARPVRPGLRERLATGERLSREGAFALLAVLVALIAVTLPELGSNPRPFRPGAIEAEGPLAPLVRAAGEEWDVGIARAAAFVAALLCAIVALPALRRRSWPAWAGSALVVVVALALLLPSTLLQLGLRDSTEPWFFTNDSTYQNELAGERLIDGDSPYGRDYKSSGLERFYSLDGSVTERVLEREVSLEHYAYFPGTALTAAPWSLLPEPFDDYRLFVLLATLASFLAVLAFRAPLSWRLAIGAIVVCNPIAIRSAWFGQNDAPSILLTILAFALVTRGRMSWAAASLAGAILLKQFALVAVPFLALMMWKRGGPLKLPAVAFAGVLAAGILPFAVADPVAFWEDTVEFGAGTFRIVGYGLAGILVRLGIVESREEDYPFALLALVLWLPLTVWLLALQRRSRELWVGAAGFSVSILVLLFIGRVFNNYYLVWPMMGAAIAAAVYASERASLAPASPSSASPSSAPTRTGTSGP